MTVCQQQTGKISKVPVSNTGAFFVTIYPIVYTTCVAYNSGKSSQFFNSFVYFRIITGVFQSVLLLLSSLVEPLQGSKKSCGFVAPGFVRFAHFTRGYYCFAPSGYLAE